MSLSRTECNAFYVGWRAQQRRQRELIQLLLWSTLASNYFQMEDVMGHSVKAVDGKQRYLFQSSV